MKRFIGCFFCFCIIFINSSCQDSQTSNLLLLSNKNCKTISVDATTVRNVNPEKVFKDIGFIRLETNQKCLIGKIDQIEFYNNKIFILDGISNSICIFNRDGKFVTRINNRGKGPGEYSTIDKFRIERDTLYIADNDFLKIIQFSLSGEFIKEKKLRFNFSDFQISNNRYLFYNDNLPQRKGFSSKLLCFDNEFNLKSKFFDYDAHKDYRRRNFYEYGEKIRFVHGLDEYIYEILENEILPVYKIDFGSNKYNTKKPLTYEYLFSEDFENSQYAVFPDYVIENDDFLYFNYTRGNLGFMLFYSKLNNRSYPIYQVKSNSLLSCISGLPLNLIDNKFVTYIDPYKFLEKNREPIKDPILKAKFDEMGKQVTVNDNPIIVLYTINIDANWYE